MSDDLVRIFSTDQLYEAEIVKQMLIDNEITAFIMNKKDSFYKFGDIELYVHRNNAIRSKKLIQEYENR